jgi:hypothetical protein
MDICQDHWHELKNALRQRGLWGLVPRGQDSHITANQRLQSAGGPSEPSNIEPLSLTVSLISAQALMAFGDYLLTRPYCPLCEVEENLGRGISCEWIITDADTVLQFCKERNLISL